MLDKQRLTTFVLGGIAGVLAGILLAPRSGKELRGSMASRAGEARERSRETYFEAQERMRERVSKARERPFGPGEDSVANTLPKLAPAAPETTLEEYEPSVGTPPVTPPSPLRDASRPPQEDPDTEEIRRRIRETRSRLQARLDEDG